VDSGFNVLADKPWIIDPAKYPMLEKILTDAEARGLVAYDIMTERYEITSLLQRMLVGQESVFGTVVEGTPRTRRSSRAVSITSRKWSPASSSSARGGSSTHRRRARAL
jgi:hypothetical protein